jgi:hypothetical protein
MWHPQPFKRLLAQYGFSVEQIIITGHHPERIPFIGSFLRRGTPQKIALWLSKLFGLGDTFEVYARKFKPYITN